MDVNERARANLLQNFEYWKYVIDTHLDELKADLKIVDSVEGLMQVNKRFLMNYVKIMPIGQEFCYFRILTGDCPHSDYLKRVRNAQSELRKVLEDFYKGEFYD